MNDLIRRQAAIEAFIELPNCSNGYSDTYDKASIIEVLESLPSAQLKMYGYNIDHLMLIARALEEKNIPPEDVADVVKDMRLAWNFVLEEFESSLKKSLLEQMPLPEPPKKGTGE